MKNQIETLEEEVHDAETENQNLQQIAARLEDNTQKLLEDQTVKINNLEQQVEELTDETRELRNKLGQKMRKVTELEVQLMEVKK